MQGSDWLRQMAEKVAGALVKANRAKDRQCCFLILWGLADDGHGQHYSRGTTAIHFGHNQVKVGVFTLTVESSTNFSLSLEFDKLKLVGHGG